MAAPLDERASANVLNGENIGDLLSGLTAGEWPKVATDLHFTKSEIEQLKKDHQQVKGQILNMIGKWCNSLKTITQSDVAILVQSLKNVNRMDLAAKLEAMMKGKVSHFETQLDNTHINVTGDKNTTIVGPVKGATFNFN